MDLEKLKEWFNSEEGQESIAEYKENLKKKEEIKNKQLERLHKLDNFEQFTIKVTFCK